MSETKTYTTEERERLGAFLSLLASMNSTVAATMVEAFDIVPLSANDRRFINGPIVVHAQRGYTPDSVPDWMWSQTRAERMEIILGPQPDMIVGPTEMAAVMYNASLDAPFNRDMGELYLWAGSHARAKYENCAREVIWAKVAKGMPMITDDDVIRRGGRLFMHYRELAHEIRRKVDRNAKRNTDIDRIKAIAAFFRGDIPPPIREAPPPVALAAE